MAKEKNETTTDDVANLMGEQKASETKPKMVEVDAEVLKGILERLNTVEQRAGEFEQTASQDQIRKIEGLRAQGKLVKSVKIRRYNGKLILGWATTEDSVWVADGKLHEVQKLDLFFEDATKENVTLKQFTSGASYEPYEVLKESKTMTGEIEYTLILPGGKNIIIMEKYVN